MFEDPMESLGGLGGAGALGPGGVGLQAGMGAIQALSGGTSSAETGAGNRSFQTGSTYFAPPTEQVQAQSWVQMAPWIALAVLALLYLVARK